MKKSSILHIVELIIIVILIIIICLLVKKLNETNNKLAELNNSKETNEINEKQYSMIMSFFYENMNNEETQYGEYEINNNIIMVETYKTIVLGELRRRGINLGENLVIGQIEGSSMMAVKIYGNDEETLKNISKEIDDILENLIPGIYNVGQLRKLDNWSLQIKKQD